MSQPIQLKAATLPERNSTSRSPSRRAFFLIPLVLACFALAPAAQAVSPPPDGGYANGNTAEGTQALFSLTTGKENTADGYKALVDITTGSFNTATGFAALFKNGTASNNTGTGYEALKNNTTAARTQPLVSSAL